MTPNPTYEEVCSARTGHNEVVLVVYRPAEISYEDLLARFWECHDPTQGMRQGNDVGTQYRSGIYTTTDEQARRGQRLARPLPGGADRRRPRRDHDRDPAGAGRSTTPRTTTSSTSPRTRTATAALGGTGVSCPIGAGALSSGQRTPGSPAVRLTSARKRKCVLAAVVARCIETVPAIGTSRPWACM